MALEETNTEIFDSLDQLDAYLKKSSSTEDDIDILKADKEKEKEDDDDDDDDETDEKKENPFDKSISDLEAIINDTPILKAVVDNLDHLNSYTEKMEEKFTKSLSQVVGVMKSMADGSGKNAEMLKSIQDEVIKIGNTSIPAPGIQNQVQLDHVLFKSVADKKDVKINPTFVKSIILKGIMENKVGAGEITRLELGTSFDKLAPATQNFVKSYLEGGKA